MMVASRLRPMEIVAGFADCSQIFAAANSGVSAGAELT